MLSPFGNNSFQQLLHDCLAVLLKEISDLSKRTIHALDPTGRKVYPLRVFLLTVVADGAEVAHMTMAGNKCPCCTVAKSGMDKTDLHLEPREGPQVRACCGICESFIYKISGLNVD